MQVNVSHHDWQALRQLLRAKKPPVLGKELRMGMARRTRDGSFLTLMVRLGLLTIEGRAKHPFEAFYSLTEQGKFAAEYGFFEIGLDEYRAYLKAAKA